VLPLDVQRASGLVDVSPFEREPLARPKRSLRGEGDKRAVSADLAHDPPDLLHRQRSDLARFRLRVLARLLRGVLVDELPGDGCAESLPESLRGGIAQAFR